MITSLCFFVFSHNCTVSHTLYSDFPPHCSWNLIMISEKRALARESPMKVKSEMSNRRKYFSIAATTMWHSTVSQSEMRSNHFKRRFMTEIYVSHFTYVWRGVFFSFCFGLTLENSQLARARRRKAALSAAGVSARRERGNCVCLSRHHPSGSWWCEVAKYRAHIPENKTKTKRWSCTSRWTRSPHGIDFARQWDE